MESNTTPDFSNFLCKDSCLIDNTNNGGYDIRSFNLGPIYDCQYYCQLEPACNYYVVLKPNTAYNSGIPRCYLKYFNGVYNSNWDPNTMAGTRNCNMLTSMLFLTYLPTPKKLIILNAKNINETIFLWFRESIYLTFLFQKFSAVMNKCLFKI
jgi:hypothetical protein